jgi:hypothetical protein
MRRTSFAVIACLGALVCFGCSEKSEPRKQLTERQRDSLIGVSGLYGGTVVTRALSASDSMAARSARMNDAVKSTGDDEQTKLPPP